MADDNRHKTAVPKKMCETEACGDYSRIETTELMKMEAAAYSEYYKLATRPRTNPSKADLEPLEKATAKYEAICAELWKRSQCDI